jgi:hypothetical protein
MTADFALFDLDSLYIEIDPRQQAQAWQQSQSLSTSASRWSAYVNQLGLAALIAWLKSEGLAAKSALAAPLLPTVWELVSGSAIECQGARLILLPVESIDGDELRVPQDWVDIPSWVGDYYLSLQVNPDESWVRFAGFATHQTLKTEGDYDWRDRTYSLDAAELTPDINVLHTAQTLYPEAVKRATVAPLPPLSVVQAHQLIERLSNAETVREPRLAIGFEPWGALLAHGGWRRQLAEHRWGQAERSISQWLQSGISQMAEQLGWQQMSYQAIAVARGEASSHSGSGQPALCRDLEIAGELYTLQVMPLSTDEQSWRFELTKVIGVIPVGVTLQLLTEDLQPFENNSAITTEATRSLYVDVAIAQQEGIVWQVQPVPSQYEPEILRF